MRLWRTSLTATWSWLWSVARATVLTDTVKRVTLELGGKSPSIVFPDIDDVDAVVARLANRQRQVRRVDFNVIVRIEIAHAQALQLLERHGVVTREGVRAEGERAGRERIAAVAEQVGGGAADDEVIATSG